MNRELYRVLTAEGEVVDSGLDNLEDALELATEPGDIIEVATIQWAKVPESILKEYYNEV